MTEEYSIVCPHCQKDDNTFITVTEINLGYYKCDNRHCSQGYFRAELPPDY